jgi:hypothetical protein
MHDKSAWSIEDTVREVISSLTFISGDVSLNSEGASLRRAGAIGFATILQTRSKHLVRIRDA